MEESPEFNEQPVELRRITCIRPAKAMAFWLLPAGDDKALDQPVRPTGPGHVIETMTGLHITLDHTDVGCETDFSTKRQTTTNAGQLFRSAIGAVPAALVLSARLDGKPFVTLQGHGATTLTRVFGAEIAADIRQSC